MRSDTIGVSLKEVMEERPITLVIHRAKEFRFRLWIATQLIRLAAWIAWMDVEFKNR